MEAEKPHILGNVFLFFLEAEKPHILGNVFSICMEAEKPHILGNVFLFVWRLKSVKALDSVSVLAHLSRRLRGELIVYRSSRRPSVRASVNTFKHEYLCNQ